MIRHAILLATLMAIPQTALAEEEGFLPPMSVLPGADCPHALTLVSTYCGMEHLRICPDAVRTQHLTVHEEDGSVSYRASYAAGLVTLGSLNPDSGVAVITSLDGLVPVLAGDPEAVYHAVYAEIDIDSERRLSGSLNRRVIQHVGTTTRAVGDEVFEILTLRETAHRPASDTAFFTLSYAPELGTILAVDGWSSDGGAFSFEYIAIIRPGEPHFSDTTRPASIACTPE